MFDTTGSPILVTAPSRHPLLHDAYDPRRHRYKERYVRAGGSLTLRYRPWALDRADGESAPRVSVVEWEIRQIDGTFTAVFKDRPSTSLQEGRQVKVPGSGTYAITLTVKGPDGPQTHHTTYRLRDHLIVSIGDSFAAGQGNPDVPATPSKDQRAMCKATTVKMIAERGTAWVKDVVSDVDQAVDATLEQLPFVGKAVVAYLNGVQDVWGSVADGLADLRSATVGLLRNGAGAAVEAVEEVAGWLGWGDGGEWDEISPHPAAWQEPYAYRSYRSGHSLAAGQVETQTATSADRVTFLSLARSGSEVRDGILGPRRVEGTSIDAWAGHRGQVDEARREARGRPIDALLVTIGINDLEFSSLVKDAILTASGEKRHQRMDRARKKIEQQLPDDLDTLRRAVEDKLHPRHVFLLEYPVGVFQEIAEGHGPCGVLTSEVGLNLDAADAKGLGQLGRLLNRQLRRKAHEFGWTLVDGIETGFAGHGYCAEKSFFVSAEESCLDQGDFEGMIHPNKLGHGLTRDRIAAELTRQLISPDTNTTTPIIGLMLAS